MLLAYGGCTEVCHLMRRGSLDCTRAAGEMVSQAGATPDPLALNNMVEDLRPALAIIAATGDMV